MFWVALSAKKFTVYRKYCTTLVPYFTQNLSVISQMQQTHMYIYHKNVKYKSSIIGWNLTYLQPEIDNSKLHEICKAKVISYIIHEKVIHSNTHDLQLIYKRIIPAML